MPEQLRGAIIVIAKTPEPGRVKTRLCPPLSAAQACEVAWACLLDTLDAAAAVPSQRHVLLLSGPPGPWIPDGFEVIEQRGAGLAERLAAGFFDVGDTAVLVAMDTPQLSSASLTSALAALYEGHDSVLGMALDGGYWLVGLRAGVDPDAVFVGVPMSTSDTGAAQQARLTGLGHCLHQVDVLRDIDTWPDLVAVANSAPQTRLGQLFAGQYDAVVPRWPEFCRPIQKTLGCT